MAGTSADFDGGKLFSIIIPAESWNELTEKCVQNCSKFYPNSEILLILDRKPQIKLNVKNLIIHIVEKNNIAFKRNFAVARANAQFIAFIDSDAYPARGWLESAFEVFISDNNNLVVAGPNIPPEGGKEGEKIVSMVEQSALVTMNAHYVKRRGQPKVVKFMPSCNLVVRKKVYEHVGGMDEGLHGGEDLEFCRKLLHINTKISYHPDVCVYHKSRSFVAFLKKRLSYGGFAIDMMRGGASLAVLTTLLPACFVIFIFTAPLTLFFPNYSVVYSIVMTIYIATLFIESVRVCKKTSSFGAVLIGVFLGSLLPGVGSILRLLDFLPDYKKIYRNYE